MREPVAPPERLGHGVTEIQAVLRKRLAGVSSRLEQARPPLAVAEVHQDARQPLLDTDRVRDAAEVSFRNRSLAGLRSPPSPPEAARTWLCDGSSLSSSVTVSLPPVSPRSWSDKPGPCPGCITADPSTFGSAKFDFPSPP